MPLFTIKPKPGMADSGNEGYSRLYNYQWNYRYNELIKEIGFGYYQYKILACVALMNTSLGVFMALMPLLIPLYKMENQIDKWSVGLLISSQGLGSLVGGIFFSYLSDIRGRKLSLMLALVTWIITSLACTFFNDFTPFLIMRLIAAMGYGGMMPVSITYLTEYLPDHRRAFYLIVMEIFKNLGGLLAIIVAAVSSDSWRFFVLSPVPMFVINLFLMQIMLPESIRYLLFKDDFGKVVQTLNEMCEKNGKNFTVEWSAFTISAQVEERGPGFVKKRDVRIFHDLFWRKARTTIPLWFVWFFPAFGSGLFAFLPEIMLQQNFSMAEIYWVQSAAMIVPMIGSFLSSIFIDTFGRKQLIALCSVIAGLSLLIFLMLPSENVKIETFLIIISTHALFMKVLKSVTQTYTPELYSTSTRTTALGIMSGIDRSAGILQPIFFTSLIYSSLQGAMTGFGVWFLLGFLWSLALDRETANLSLKDSNSVVSDQVFDIEVTSRKSDMVMSMLSGH